MITEIGGILAAVGAGLGIPSWLAWVACQLLRRDDSLPALGVIIGNAVAAVGYFLTGEWVSAGISSAIAAVWALDWWRKRKQRKRALQALGYKAKARLAALVRKHREVTRPRPALRPVPGGAR